MKHTIKVHLYALISRAVDEGITYGLNRAYKHTDNPDRETIIESLDREIMTALCEVIEFDES